MNNRYCTLLCIFSLIACNESNKTIKDSTVQSSVDSILISEVKYHEIRKLFVSGDFDGDKKQDTLYEHFYSNKLKIEIDSAADPFQNEWDAVIKWFYDQDVTLSLKSNRRKLDSLNFGIAQGCYCLINIGDVDKNGKDELAIVIDKLDYSSINSCLIYSLHNSKWVLQKRFEIHEDAFNYSSDTVPIFKEIRGFLERKNNRWYYKDYSEQIYDKQEDAGKMKLLKLEKLIK